MDFLIKPLIEIEEYNEIIRTIKNNIEPINIIGPSDSQKVHISYALCTHSGLRGLYIAFNEMQARKIYDDMTFFAGEDVVFFPAKELVLHDVEAKSNDAVFQRIKALERIIRGEYKYIVTSAEAIVQKLASREAFRENILDFSIGGRIDHGSITQKLISMGYERVATVEGQGQFSIRGGIIDIFSAGSEDAVRIELFDDEIDSIRRFNALTQRSIEQISNVTVLPSREITYSPEKREGIIKSIEKELASHIKKFQGKADSSHLNKLKEKVSADIDRIRNEYYFSGMDRYIPFIIDESTSLLDYMEDSTVVYVDENTRVKQRIENILMEYYETSKNMLEKGSILPGSERMFFDYSDMERWFEKHRAAYLNTMPTYDRKSIKSTNFSIPTKALSGYYGNTDLLIDDIKHLKENRYRILILAGPRGRGERLLETLRSNGVEASYSENYDSQIQPGQVIVSHGSLNKGFEYPSINLVVISDKEVFGQDKKARKLRGKKDGKPIKAFTDLNLGDYVVHQAHGIGQYVGIQKLAVGNVKRDYIKIKYQDGGYLYIPTNQMDLIQKYIGTEGKAPKLNKLGGSEWAKTKARVKESLKELAAELIKLYAQRQSVKGFTYSKDTVWQNQFEELFPYQETDDQLKCIEDIKADMESERLMDRLLCGDVGYGKTEVAIRAVFKAVMDGKQVAYLVPTTVLAQQQYNSFKERMKDFPVKVDVISRFRTQAEQKKILKDVKAGNVDVLVGTHRLIQKDVQFKDLGLLIVDEEQRFGVTHKEKLKNFKPNVDVLTLTATPIPRTLHMSLVGIRDISVLEDPPEERYPVQTYVMEHDPDVIRDAITRELGRKGQVFYLYNRVRSIEVKAAEINSLVPDARVGVAHGQMDEKELEDIMYSFLNGEYDVLVCTTIIESGLDLPNVNTIIVEDADRMGLAQLYQLRGRVGRSNRLAYAYITYKRDKVLSEIAEKRLQAIKEFTEFGSGFKIAMRDLEIRGAGNLLGPEQHGHMDTVGYDMYCKLLDEAVRELKGESLQGGNMEEITIDINISAYIDDSYISSEDQKIDMYKKIASVQDENDIMDVEDELTDRYGDIPQPVINLIQVAKIKMLAKECGFIGIQEKNDAVLLQYRKETKVDLQGLGKLMEKYRRRLLFTASNSPYITLKIDGISREALLENIKILLQDIKKLHNA